MRTILRRIWNWVRRRQPEPADPLEPLARAAGETRDSAVAAMTKGFASMSVHVDQMRASILTAMKAVGAFACEWEEHEHREPDDVRAAKRRARIDRRRV